jgi:hypothetical protein
MGYSNKRRRSKRRRTRSLNAMQNHGNFQDHNLSSSDDSSLDLLEQSSSFTSFCSTYSHHSYPSTDAGMIPPSSIFLDDLNIDMQVDHTEDDQYSVVDNIENADQLLNYREATLEDNISTQDDDVTVRTTSSSVENSNPDGYPADHQHHCFDQMSREETASYKIMSLLDEAGAPRICYDRLVSLLKKLTKNDGFDVKKALNRETLMRRLERRYKTRPRIESSIVNQQEVFRFKFHDMLQEDLLHSSHRYLHEILPNCDQDNLAVGTEHELWNTPWMRSTFATEKYIDFDPKTDIMLPLILYMDKTGTDVNQRYSLEPVLFSVAAIPREYRESRHSWRHFGFIPQKKNAQRRRPRPTFNFITIVCPIYWMD